MKNRIWAPLLSHSMTVTKNLFRFTILNKFYKTCGSKFWSLKLGDELIILFNKIILTIQPHLQFLEGN